MTNGKFEVEHFINNKVHSLPPLDSQKKRPKKEVRRKWTGHFINVDRSSDITINMFREVEMHLQERGWMPYGWAAKSKPIARKLYSKEITSKEYTRFPTNQNHWDAFYCSRHVSVAMGYFSSETSMLRIYIKKEKIRNIWNTGQMHLGRNSASAIMVAAKLREPPLSFFGITGPQSTEEREPETALFGSEINQNMLCVPVPDSIPPNELEKDPYFKRIYYFSTPRYDTIETFLRGLV